jgi:hypothetical protein
MLERDSGLSQEEIVNEVNRILSGKDKQQNRHQPASVVPSTPTLASTLKSTANQPLQMKEQKKTEVEFDEDGTMSCPIICTFVSLLYSFTHQETESCWDFLG